MSRKNTISAFPMLDQADASSDVISLPTDVKNLDNASIRVTWTGTPIGTLTVQAQQEKSDTSAAQDAASWFDIDLGATIAIDANETDHQLIFTQLPFDKIRLSYTSTSGTGTISAKISAKQVGG
jgi:hypothetical protein